MAVLETVYNMLLLVVLFVPIILSLVCYSQYKKNVFLVTMLLYLVYAADHIVICLTELIPAFSHKYNEVFMVAPTWKTIVYLTSFASLMYLFKQLLPNETFIVPIALLATMTIFQLFVPLFDNNATKVWLYYLPAQVYLFAFSLVIFTYIRRAPDRKTNVFVRMISSVNLILLIFPILITIEDYIVIFYLDEYEKSFIIHNRNICEDIERMILVGVTSYALVKLISSPKLLDRNIDFSNSEIIDVEEIEKTVLISDENSDITDTTAQKTIELKTKQFYEEYQLTAREQSIFGLILADMSNQEISEKLMISLGTTKTHTHNIFNKLNVTKRKDLKALYNAYLEK